MIKPIRLLSSLFIAFVTASTAVAHSQQIAFTWDDLPAHSTLPPHTTRVQIGRDLIAAMKAERLPPVYGFVNSILTEREPLSTSMLQDWRDAGFLLGNHTWSHTNLNTSSVEAWQADALKNEPLISSYMGKRDFRWLRYPYLAEGNTPEKRLAARKFLADHHYKIAAVTMSFGDYAFNDPYARCVINEDNASITQLEDSYLKAASDTIDYARGLSQNLYNRDIPYVLLMHVGAFDARMLPRLLKLYRDRGFTFITLEQAEEDPFYKNSIDPTLSPIPDTLEEAARTRNLPVPQRPKPTVNLETICR
jgi:peptidoglycan/xylan/chitin deacetylase (PgdA/CDA1 family)